MSGRTPSTGAGMGASAAGGETELEATHALCAAHLKLLGKLSHRGARLQHWVRMQPDGFGGGSLFVRASGGSRLSLVERAEGALWDVPVDGVLDADSQREVSDEFQVLLPVVELGEDAVVAAVGAPGSGKSYTLFGTPRSPGLVLRFASDLFEHLASLERPAYAYVQFLLVSESSSVDLLTPEPSSGAPSESSAAKSREYAVASLSDLCRFLDSGLARRERELSSQSTSSLAWHTVVTVLVERAPPPGAPRSAAHLRSSVHFVECTALSPLRLRALEPLKDALSRFRQGLEQRSSSDGLVRLLGPSLRAGSSRVFLLSTLRDGSAGRASAPMHFRWIRQLFRLEAAEAPREAAAARLRDCEESLHRVGRDVESAKEFLNPMTLVLKQARSSLAAIEALLLQAMPEFTYEEQDRFAQAIAASAVPPYLRVVGGLSDQAAHDSGGPRRGSSTQAAAAASPQRKHSPAKKTPHRTPQRPKSHVKGSSKDIVGASPPSAGHKSRKSSSAVGCALKRLSMPSRKTSLPRASGY